MSLKCCDCSKCLIIIICDDTVNVITKACNKCFYIFLCFRTGEVAKYAVDGISTFNACYIITTDTASKFISCTFDCCKAVRRTVDGITECLNTLKENVINFSISVSVPILMSIEVINDCITHVFTGLCGYGRYIPQILVVCECFIRWACCVCKNTNYAFFFHLFCNIV